MPRQYKPFLLLYLYRDLEWVSFMLMVRHRNISYYDGMVSHANSWLVLRYVAMMSSLLFEFSLF